MKQLDSVNSKILVVEDDARWAADLLGSPRNFFFARDFASGLAAIDKRRRWSGAVFDRYLLEGDVPMSLGSIRRDAGLILATEFLRCFPGKRVCVVSGDHDLSTAHAQMRLLAGLENFKFVYKGRARSHEAVLKFLDLGQDGGATLDSVLDHLVLEPNFCGLGLNLGKLVKSCRSYFRRSR